MAKEDRETEREKLPHTPIREKGSETEEMFELTSRACARVMNGNERRRYVNGLPSLEMALKHARLYSPSITDEEVTQWWQEREASMWCDLKGWPIKNWAYHLVIWVKEERKARQKDNPEPGEPLPKARAMIDKETRKNLASKFMEFWNAYPGPRRKDKRKCWNKFRAILSMRKDSLEKTFHAMMEGLENWKRCADWTKEGGLFICAPLVWLNNERWNDAVLSVSDSTIHGHTANNNVTCDDHRNLF